MSFGGQKTAFVSGSPEDERTVICRISVKSFMLFLFLQVLSLFGFRSG